MSPQSLLMTLDAVQAGRAADRCSNPVCAERPFSATNHLDKPFVRLLATCLGEHGVRVWVDKAKIKIGDSLIGKIEEGIQGGLPGRHLSPHSVGSKWVKEERRAVLALQIATDRMKVLPILVEDCTPPLFLADKLLLDVRGWEDPSVFGDGLTRLLADIDICTEAVCLLKRGCPFWASRKGPSHSAQRPAVIGVQSALWRRGGAPIR